MNGAALIRPALTGLLAAVLLAGCGGGGGGGSGNDGGDQGGGDQGGGGQGQTSGLVPDPPAIGATLQDDALLLRGMHDQAVMVFRGTDSSLPSRYYTNTVTQTQSGAVFTENQSNPLNAGSAGSTDVSTANGTISETETMQVVPGTPAEQVNFIEVRSPVRVNDRYVHLDRHYDDGGIDADGDGKHDAVDIAAWTQVIGRETIDLHHRSGISAVRLDETIRLRVKYSSNGQYSDIVEYRGSTWMSEGLGIVKTSIDWPSDIDPRARILISEELVTRDAVDSGLGYTNATTQTAPAGSNIAGQTMPMPTDVVAYPEHITVLSPTRPTTTGFVLSQLDQRGAAVAAHYYDYQDLLGERAFNVRMVRFGEELRLVVQSNSGLKMLGFDATGQQQTLAQPVLLNTDVLSSDEDGTRYSIAAVGDSLWLAWITYPEYVNGSYFSKIQAQRFSAAGQPQEGVITVADNVRPGALWGVSVEDAGGRALFKWADGNGINERWQYRVYDGSTAQYINGQGLDTHCDRSYTTQQVGGRTMLVCDGSPDVAAITLDANWAPVQTTGGAERVDGGLPDWWTVAEPVPLDVVSANDHLAIAGSRFGTLWPEEQDIGYTQFADMAVDADGVLQRTLVSSLAKVPQTEFTPVRQAPMGNRVVAIGTDISGNLITMVVWRP